MVESRDFQGTGQSRQVCISLGFPVPPKAPLMVLVDARGVSGSRRGALSWASRPGLQEHTGGTRSSVVPTVAKVEAGFICE